MKHWYHVNLPSLGDVNQELGQKLYGNTSGFVANLASRAAVIGARARTGFQIPRTDVQEQIYERGYIRLGQVLEEEKVDRIVSEAARHIEDDAVELNEEGHLLREALLSTHFSFKDSIPEIFDVLGDETGEILEGYYGAHFKPVYASIYRNHHVPEGGLDFHGNRWHFDSYTPDHARLFVMLSDPEEAGAPLHVLDRQQSRQAVKEGLTGAEELDGYEPRELDLSKGEAVLTNTAQILHRGGNPPEGSTREMIQITFAPSSKPIENPRDLSPPADLESDLMGFGRLFRY